MLKKRFRLFLLLFFILAGFMAANLAIIEKKDFTEYNLLVNSKKENKETAPKSARQKRTGVQKDIFALQNDESRLHLCIHSAKSELFLSPEKSSFEMIEKLKEIQCYLKDEAAPGAFSTQLRYFTAQSGTYTFPSHEFLAGAIEIYFFQQPSSALFSELSVDDAYLKGFANRISFFLTDKTPHFKAHHFKASFNPDKGKP